MKREKGGQGRNGGEKGCQRERKEREGGTDTIRGKLFFIIRRMYDDFVNNCQIGYGHALDLWSHLSLREGSDQLAAMNPVRYQKKIWRQGHSF